MTNLDISKLLVLQHTGLDKVDLDILFLHDLLKFFRKERLHHIHNRGN